MINKGQYVRCMLHNGFVVEGIVENWSQENVILISLTDESQLIIPNPDRDIMFVKIVIKQQKLPASTPEIDIKIEQTLQEPFSDLKVKKLSELKQMKIAEERAIIANKLKSHSIGQPGKVTYGPQHSIFKK